VISSPCAAARTAARGLCEGGNAALDTAGGARRFDRFGARAADRCAGSSNRCVEVDGTFPAQATTRTVLVSSYPSREPMTDNLHEQWAGFRRGDPKRRVAVAALARRQRPRLVAVPRSGWGP
jgi:hypothetical protein